SLTSIPAGNLTGTIADARLSGNIPSLSANQTFSGQNTMSNFGNSFAGNFTGNGAGVTGINLLTANSAGAITWTTNSGPNFVIDSAPTAGLRPGWGLAADVNGDGWVDLVSADHGTNSLTVLTNDGGGRFALSAS